MNKSFCFLALLCFFSGFNFQELESQEQRIIVHDPVMAMCNNHFYLFCTGYGISNWTSDDMVSWKPLSPVFNDAPQWAVKAVPDFKNDIWAPDIYYYNNKYYLFYSVSAFSKNTSCIGVATNPTLDPDSKEYKWTDHGCVMQSVPNRDMWNAIDPNLIIDEKQQAWLVFGSFWEGIKLVKLNSDLTSIAVCPQEWYSLARRSRSEGLDDKDPGNGAIEAPFIFKKSDYYYLFVSIDYCCRGINSNYKVAVGRSKQITGPYLDRDGKDMVQGGGTVVISGNAKWPGAGHNAVHNFNGTDYIIFHAYESADNGTPKLIVNKLEWDQSGWPDSVSLP